MNGLGGRRGWLGGCVVALTALLLWVPPAASASASGKGYLNVHVTDLPAGLHASIWVVGPLPSERCIKSRRIHLTRSADLLVPPGRYEIRAQAVRTGTMGFFPTVVPQSPVSIAEGQESDVTVSYLTEVPRTTEVLGASALSDLKSVSPDQSVLVFGPSSSVPSLAPGDIIAAGVSTATPSGLLRKVVSVSRSRSGVTVQTTMATLQDAVARGGIYCQRRADTRHDPERFLGTYQ
jgi:hypothetical protein